jgi:hypothetical protein
MAKRKVVTLEDDLDGGPADETLRFGVDGSEYEIDLSKKNAATLHRLLAPFIARARKAGSGARRPARTAASRRRSADIRAWAKQQGIELSDRGRIPGSVVAKYEAAGDGTGRGPQADTRRRRRLTARRRSARVFDHHPVLHDEDHIGVLGEAVGMLQWVAGEAHDVRAEPGAQRAHLVG